MERGSKTSPLTLAALHSIQSQHELSPRSQRRWGNSNPLLCKVWPESGNVFFKAPVTRETVVLLRASYIIFRKLKIAVWKWGRK